MDYAEEAPPEEHANPEDPEFCEPDLTGLNDIRRRGVAPSLLAAEQKWEGMFKRNSPLVAWQVGFRTFRRAHSGDTTFPEGFPDLQAFFDKCQNIQVIEWIVGVYKELVDDAVAAGVYMPGDKTEIDILREHVVLWAGRHGHWQMQVRNPAWRDPEFVQPKKKRGMFDPRPPKLTPEQRKKEQQLREQSAAQTIPKTIPKTFVMTKVQKHAIALLARKFKIFAAPFGPYPLQVRLAMNWAKVFKLASSVGKWCIYLRARRDEIAGKKSAMSSAMASAPGSPSLAKRPLENHVAVCGSPSLKRVCV